MKDTFLWFLLGLAILTRFFYFNYPGEVVFDEVHFGKFVRAYFTEENYFDIHPPTGKLLIAGIAKLGGFNPDTNDFNEIGQEYDAQNLFLIRILPTIASVVFVGVIYLLTKRLTRSRLTAALAGSVVLFENSLITQARFGLLDIFLLLFGFGALYLYFRAEDMFEMHEKHRWAHSVFMSKRTILLVLTGIALGLSYSIKWTGFGFAVVVGIAALMTLVQHRTFKEFFAKLALIYLVSFLIYVIGFAVHFALLTKPGAGDAYLSQNFREKTFVEQFSELNERMFFYNRTITTEHPFSSKWYAWPFNTKPIFYWQENKTDVQKQELENRLAVLREELTRNPENLDIIERELTTLQSEMERFDAREEIWLVGNPIVWFLGGVSVMFGLLLLVVYAMSSTALRNFPARIVTLLLLAWAVSYLPLAPIARPLFLYHYFTPLIFSLILFGVLLEYAIRSYHRAHAVTRTVFATTIVLIVAGYFITAPLTYGIPFKKQGAYRSIIDKLL